MKLCFSTLGCFYMTLEQTLSLANSYGISAIEIRGLSGELDNATIPEFSEAERAKTSALFATRGVLPAVLGTSVSFHNAEKFNASIEKGFEELALARALGIENIRVFGDRLAPDKDACIARVADGLKRLCDSEPSVNVLLEVHGDFNTEQTLTPVIEKLADTKNFGLIWDIEHTHKSYKTDWKSFYDFARPYVRHIHIKDFSDSAQALTLVGGGDVPILPITERLLCDGYDGYFSLEWEKKWHPELPDIETALDSFVGVMKGVKI